MTGSARALQQASARDLCWRSEKELGGLADRLRAALDAWGDAWGVSVMDFTCRNAWEGGRAVGSAASRHWLAIATGNDGMPLVHLGVETTSLTEALATVMFGAATGTALGDRNVRRPTLAHSIAVEAVGALKTTLARCLDLQPVEEGVETGKTTPCPPRAWSGTVTVTATLRAAATALPLEFRLASQAIARPKKQQSTDRRLTTGSLQPVLDIIANRPIRVRAMLNETPMTLRHLLELSPGDVIVSSHPLGAPLSVVTSSPASQQLPNPLYAGRLAQADRLMALTLASATELIPRSFS